MEGLRIISRNGKEKTSWGAWGQSALNPGDVMEHESVGRFRVIRPIQYRTMKVGTIYADSYSDGNVGVDLFKFLGYSDVTKKYGEGGPVFESIQGIKAKYKVKNLSQIEDLDTKLKLPYGHSVYMWGEHYDDKIIAGGFYYLYNGRWSRGSGAEALTFWEVEQI